VSRSSSARKAGLSTTSAKRASDGSRFAFNAESVTEVESRSDPAPSCAPSLCSLVADLQGASASSCPRPSCRRRAARARRRELVRGVAGVDQQVHPDDRHLVALGHDELEAARQPRPLEGRQPPPPVPRRGWVGLAVRAAAPAASSGKGWTRARRHRRRASCPASHTSRVPAAFTRSTGRGRNRLAAPHLLWARTSDLPPKPRSARRRARTRRGAPSSPARSPRPWGRPAGSAPSPRSRRLLHRPRSPPGRAWPG